MTLKDLDTMLAERIDRWNRERKEWLDCWKEGWKEAWKKGWREGIQEGQAELVLQLLRLKFGLLEPEIEDRVRSADSKRLQSWGARVLTAGTLEEVLQD